MTMNSLEEQVAAIDAKLRTWSLPAHVLRDVERGEAALRAHEAEKTKLMREREELAAAMKQQLSDSEYQRRRKTREQEEAETAAAQAALQAAVERYLDAHDDIVRLQRMAAEANARALAEMGEVGRLAAGLGSGRRPDSCSVIDLEKALSLLNLASLKAGLPPTYRNRFGVLEFASAIDARYPPGHDWAEAEKVRMARHVLPLAQG